MKKRKGVLIGIILLGLVLTPALTQAEELKVPFSAIKFSCYGEIDMTKAEFALSEVGKECVVESWLEENLDEKMDPWGRRILGKDEKIEGVHITDLKSKYIGETSGKIKAARPAKWCKDRLILERGYITEDLKGKFLVPKAAIKDKFIDEINSEKEKVIAKKDWIKQEYFERPKKYEDDLDWLLDKSQPSLEEVVEIIDTPKQLLYFMNHYFVIGHYPGRSTGGMTSYTPSKFLQTKVGGCKDYATFATYVLSKNNYKTKILTYSKTPSDPGGHSVAVYWIKGKMYYLTTQLHSAKIYGPFPNTTKLLASEVRRRPDLTKKPPSYEFIPAGSTNVSQNQ